jgi:methionine-rich copper-binding protein CopC
MNKAGTGRSTASRAVAAVLGAFMVLGAVLVMSTPAQAHNYLVQSTPKAGEVLTVLPAQFSITTNDVLLNIAKNGAGFALQVKDSNGLYYGDGCIDVEGPGMSTVAALGAPGKYEVIWQVISTDGHTVSSDFSFTWQPSSADAAVSKGSATPPDCHGTLKPNASGDATAAPVAPVAADNGEGVAALLWIGGGVLAVGLAVAVTLLLTSRKKPQA